MKKVFAMAIFLLSFGAFNAQAQDYTNNKNPFDNYGTIHNEILSDFVAKQLKSGLPMETVISEGRKIIESNNRYLSAVGEGNLNFDGSTKIYTESSKFNQNSSFEIFKTVKSKRTPNDSSNCIVKPFNCGICNSLLKKIQYFVFPIV